MYRTFIILRHTFKEAVAQPIYPLMLALGAVVLIIFSFLPFYTFGEDTLMYKSVGMDVILAVVLIATLFATSKSIYEEIEDRTMLTLMSKPVSRLQVLVGKYLGVVASLALAVFLLGLVMSTVICWRIPGDYQIRGSAIDQSIADTIMAYCKMHLWGLWAGLTLVVLQVSVLAAISVAVSTRLSLVVNLPFVIIIYLAGNLSRFLYPMVEATGPLHDRNIFVKSGSYLLTLLVPFLGIFDLRQNTVFSVIGLAGTQFAKDPNAVSIGPIWVYVASAALYALAYVTFALCIGLWLFQTRELGGAEG